MRKNNTKALLIAAPAALAFVLLGCGPKYPNCNQDGDCHTGEYCVNGECQMCRSNADCPAGRGCNAGRCDPIPGYCSGTGDCPQGQECQQNHCATPVVSHIDTPPPSPGPTGPCQLQNVYFDFDSSDLGSSARDALQANANCMRDRTIARVRITGHTDPRGTEEYNLALGDRRARAASQFVTQLGAAHSAVTVRSMGEETARGSDESTWSQDRYVQFEEQ